MPRADRAGSRPQGLGPRYLDALVRGDAEGAEALVEQARARGFSTERIYLELLAPAQVEIGARWRAGRLSVADEHLATQIALALMARLRGRAAPGPARGRRAVVACVEGEHHEVGARMLADFLQLDGWTVDFLGADLPVRDLVDFAARRRPDLVALSVTLPAHAAALATAVSALRRLAPAPRILAGGAGLGPRTDAAALGVDAVALDALEGVRAARRLAGAPPSPAAGDGYFERLGRRVQELRSARGLTQQQLAQAADLDRTYVSGVERGKQNPTLGALLRLAQALDVPLERLVLDGEGVPVAAPAGPARATRR